MNPRSSIRISYGNADRVIGILLLSVFLSTAHMFNSVGARLIAAIAIAVAVIGTLQAFMRVLVLADQVMLFRDTIGRRRTFSYAEIAEVTFDPPSVLTIRMKSRDVIRFPARSKNIERGVEILRQKMSREPC